MRLLADQVAGNPEGSYQQYAACQRAQAHKLTKKKRPLDLVNVIAAQKPLNDRLLSAIIHGSGCRSVRDAFRKCLPPLLNHQSRLWRQLLRCRK